MDTIAAIATGHERSAIGIVRVSGDRAIELAERVFRTKARSLEPKRLYFGEFLNSDGEVIDHCLCTVSRAPASYTGEDTAEFQCHGSPVVLGEALRTLFKLGARQAEAGEFTKRAFLNGKMDLTGAEAVVDLIDAESISAAKEAAKQLGGAVFEKIDDIYGKIVNIISDFQVTIDFPDDETPDFVLAEKRETLANAEKTLTSLAESFENGGRYLKSGVPCALIGRPNVGKSSLLNALVGFDRAIVTPKAGTTRDTIEEVATLGGVALRLTDTAGLRDTEDEIEREGVLRSERAAKSAALVIGVFDGSEPFTKEDEATAEHLMNAEKAVALVNKCDKNRVLELELPENVPVFEVSAKTGEGLDALAEFVKGAFTARDKTAVTITSARQFEAVSAARRALGAAIEGLDFGLTPDAVLTELEDAAVSLAKMTGRRVTDDVVHDIFSRFCVGK